MELKKFKFKLDKYIYENWTFRITTLALVGVIGYQAYLLSERMSNQRVVIMPPKAITKPMWIAGNTVSKSYLEEMGLFIAYNLLNINEQTAKYTYQNILPFVEPEFYYKVRTLLKQQIDYITENQISRVFYPSIVNVDKRGVIEIKGIKKDIIGSNVVDTKSVTINIFYKIKQGRFWITGIIVKENK